MPTRLEEEGAGVIPSYEIVFVDIGNYENMKILKEVCKMWTKLYNIKNTFTGEDSNGHIVVFIVSSLFTKCYQYLNYNIVSYVYLALGSFTRATSISFLSFSTCYLWFVIKNNITRMGGVFYIRVEFFTCMGSGFILYRVVLLVC